MSTTTVSRARDASAAPNCVMVGFAPIRSAASVNLQMSTANGRERPSVNPAAFLDDGHDPHVRRLDPARVYRARTAGANRDRGEIQMERIVELRARQDTVLLPEGAFKIDCRERPGEDGWYLIEYDPLDQFITIMRRAEALDVK